MSKSPGRKDCFQECKSKATSCKSACVGTPVNLDAAVRKDVTTDEARKAALDTRAALVSALPPSIGDITAILDEQKQADPKKAEEDRRVADSEAPKNLPKAKLADFYAKRGLAAGEIGRAQQSVDDLRKATELAKGASTDVYKTALWDLAHAEGKAGLSADSIAHREDYMKLPMQNGERLAKSAVVAVVYAGIGDIAKAHERMAVAEQLLAKLQSASASSRAKYGNVWLGRSKRAKGEIYMVEGRYKEAESLFRDALYLAEADLKRGEDEKFAAQVRDFCRRNIAQALHKQDRLVEAEVEIRRTLLDTLTRVGLYSTETPRVLSTFASILTAQGRYEEAQKLMQAGIDIMEKMAFPADSTRVVGAHITLAIVSFLRGDIEGSLARFNEIEKTVANSKETLSVDSLASSRDRMLVLALAGPHEKAIQVIRQALDPKSKREAVSKTVLRGALAIALARSGDAKSAHAEFSQTIPDLMSGVRENENEDYTLETAQELRTALILEAYISHLADLRGTPLETELGVDAAEEGFKVADAARGQLVQRAVAAASARSAAKDEKLAELVRTEQDTRKRLTAQSGLLASILASPREQQDPAAVKELQDTVAKLRKGLDSLEREITKKFPDYARLLTPETPGTKQIQAALRDHEAYISIFVGKDRTYVWAVPKSGAVQFQTTDLTRERADKVVEALRISLQPQVATLGDIPDFDVRLAYRLYQQLLEPVKTGWEKATSLLVSTNGAIGQLPLSILPTERATLAQGEGPLFAGYRDVEWLARDYAVTVLPSAATLAVLKALPAGKPSRKPFIGFGNPYFSKEQADAPPQPAATAELQSRGVLKTRGIRISLRAAPPSEGGAMSDLSVLPPLPDTADEVRSLAVTMQTDPSETVQLGLKASEDVIKSEDLSRYKVIAFATHGLVPGDLSGLREPALALTAPQLAEGKNDGLLTMSEIMGLKLDADWVVLSACNTGTGRGGGAEAVSGLGRAFFYAGTRALLVSSWPVETTSARLLTTDLFRRATEDGKLDRAVALQKAMSALIDKPGALDEQGKNPLYFYAHPIFWAPFILVGDGGTAGKG
ncbi:MAG: CHAT domain-containing tetratricopeptide repeat protein [Pseudomonadota bacterium]|nr:CHAT domain-containing tetratricopeptide repeat protein [Pseudomonadota bacterium]